MTWHLGCATGLSLSRSIFDVLPALGAGGASGVEVSTPPGHFHPERAEDVQRVGRLMASLGLRAISIHAPFGRGLDLASHLPEERAAGVSAAVVAARALAALGGSIVVAHPSDLERHGQNVDTCLSHAEASLASMADHLGPLGLQLAVETPLPHLIGGHPDEFQRLLSRLPREVGACFDTGHAALGGHWDRFVETSGHRLIHVHASDNHGERDDHLPPGDGRINWTNIARSLATIHFSGWVMLELHGPAEHPEPYVRRAFAQAGERIARPVT